MNAIEREVERQKIIKELAEKVKEIEGKLDQILLLLQPKGKGK